MSKGRFFAFVWTFFLFLLQNAVTYVFPDKTPPFLLMGVIYYALQEGPLFGMALGAFAGVFLEVFTAGALGYQMVIFASCGGLSGFIASKIFRESILVQVFLPSVMLYFLTLFNLLIFKAQTGGIEGFFALSGAFRPWELLAAALVSPIAFSFLRKVSSRSISR